MIKKYAKYLILLYAAFLLDIYRVDAGGDLSSGLLPQQAFQSDIDTVVLKEPKAFIADPYNAIIELYVKTLTPIWGTSNFPDTLINFSINNTYAWGDGDILSYDPPSRRYDCASFDVYFFDDTLNSVFFHASYIKNDVNYDTIVTFPVLYAKPVVKIDTVNGNPYNDQTVVVNSSTDVSFNANLDRAYQYIDPEGNDKIIALEASLNGGGPILVWSDPSGVRYENVNFNLSEIPGLGSLNPGYNTFEFRAKGKCKTNCDEYSETFTLQVFYLNFEGLDAEVCQDDVVYELIGIPEGGYFSGEGIIDKTTLFNPSHASEGTHAITYHYPVDGTEQTFLKNFTYTARPDFELTAASEREVCFNEYDVRYAVSGTSGYDQVSWEVMQGGEIQSISENQAEAVIHWHGLMPSGDTTHTGIINVTMEKGGCIISKEFLTAIGNTKTPDPSYMMIYNKNLLLCSDTTARFFIWYRNNVMLDTTQKPYFFLGASFIPLACDEFYVMTAYELNAFSCLTMSNLYTYDCVKNNGNTPDQSELIICPNPNDGNFTVLLPDSEENEYLLTVTDLTGKVITCRSVNPLTTRGECRINGNDWQSGIYILRLEGNSTSLYKKIIITK